MSVAALEEKLADMVPPPWRVSFVCLVATLLAACSIDTRNLRTGLASGRDGAVDAPAGPDAVLPSPGGSGGQGGSEASGGNSGKDSRVLSPDDVAGANDVVALPDLPTTSDVADSAIADSRGPGGTGGSLGSGGIVPSGGSLGSGGIVPSGGTLGSGGIVASGGVDSTGGTLASGGIVASGGGVASGGTVGSGGVVASGGTVASGGVGAGGAETRDAGSGGGGLGGTSSDALSTGGTGPDPDLVLWYKFDESTGTSAADSAMFGGTARNATLVTAMMGGSASFSTNKQVGTHAVTLTPSLYGASASGGYVTVPALQPLAPEALTIAVWVNLAASTTAQNWERIFDFGTGTTANNFLYLVARAETPATTPVQFVISTKGHTASAGQVLNSPSALTANVWHHLAIVLPAGSTYTGIMYIDGVAVATNSAMTLHASDIGATSNNWLGRSQFSDNGSSDPLFSGSLDDFRVYKRALSQQEISDLFALR